MAHDDLNVLAAFLAVTEERSFTKAAKRLNVSQSALSHAIRGLEEDIGVRLLAGTTRSVAPTDAGKELLRSLSPALTDIRAALGKIYRWEFDKGKQSLTVALNRPLIVDDVDLVIRAALDDVGTGVPRRGSRRAASRFRRARSRPRAVVSAVPWVLPVLPESTTAACGAVRPDRRASTRESP